MLIFLIVTYIFYITTLNIVLSIVLANVLCIVIFLIYPFSQNYPEEYENELVVREQANKRRIIKDELIKELIEVIICSLIVLIALKGVNTYTEAAIDSIPEDNFSGVSIDSNLVIPHFELDVKSNENEFDVDELRRVLVDYKDLITTGERDSFARIKYTYYKETEGYDKYGNDVPNIECSIDFKNNDIKLMNFENITDENIVKIGTGFTLGNFTLPLPIDETCFGNEDKETNEAVENQTLIEE